MEFNANAIAAAVIQVPAHDHDYPGFEFSPVFTVEYAPGAFVPAAFCSYTDAENAAALFAPINNAIANAELARRSARACGWTERARRATGDLAELETVQALVAEAAAAMPGALAE